MPDADHQPITPLLRRIGAGDFDAEEQLISLVYKELRGMASSRLRMMSPGDPLNPTELVNEVYLRLSPSGTIWDGRAHFFGAAGRAMRQILVERVRRKRSVKRGGTSRHTWVDLDRQIPSLDPGDPQRTLEIDEALQSLESDHPLAARITELRFFVGLSNKQVADALNISERTVYREWAFARAWLRCELSGEGPRG
ncbi:MAG: ECF-type sigma factor [Planctomycetota bacterium]